MPVTRQVRLHDCFVLWPEHKSAAEVAELQKTTLGYVWDVTYQGSMVQKAGTLFKREWWTGRNRFSEVKPVARFISLDTATSEAANAAYTAWTVGDLLPDYRLAVVEIGRKRLEFPALVGWIEALYRQYYERGLLRSIVIEDKSSGIGALQTLRQAGDIAEVLQGFNPRVDKPTRWGQAAVWCSLGCVLLPEPGPRYPWLYEAETELFTVPNAAQLDQADAFSQLIIYLENFLSEGYRARSNQK